MKIINVTLILTQRGYRSAILTVFKIAFIGYSMAYNSFKSFLSPLHSIAHKMKLLPLILVLVLVFISLVDSRPSVEENSQQSSAGSSSVAGGGQETSTRKAFSAKDVATGSPKLALYFDRCPSGFKVDRTGKCRRTYNRSSN